MHWTQNSYIYMYVYIYIIYICVYNHSLFYIYSCSGYFDINYMFLNVWCFQTTCKTILCNHQYEDVVWISMAFASFFSTFRYVIIWEISTSLKVVDTFRKYLNTTDPRISSVITLRLCLFSSPDEITKPLGENRMPFSALLFTLA